MRRWLILIIDGRSEFACGREGTSMKQTLVPFDVWERSSWCGQEVAGEQYYAKAWRPLLPPSLPSKGVD